MINELPTEPTEPTPDQAVAQIPVPKDLLEKVVANFEDKNPNAATMMGRIRRLVPAELQEQALHSSEVKTAMVNFVLPGRSPVAMAKRLEAIPDEIRSDVLNDERVIQAMIDFVAAAQSAIPGRPAGPMKVRLETVPEEIREIVASHPSINTYLGKSGENEADIHRAENPRGSSWDLYIVRTKFESLARRAEIAHQGTSPEHIYKFKLDLNSFLYEKLNSLTPDNVSESFDSLLKSSLQIIQIENPQSPIFNLASEVRNEIFELKGEK